MPQAYSKQELHRVYDQIALERPHVCDECGIALYISHSHLIPRGLYGKLAIVKINIVYHCMTVGNHKGCHDQFDSMNVATMKNFEKYYRIMHSLDRSFFWQKMHKLIDHWQTRDFAVYQRVRALFAEIDKLDHPYKTLS